GTSSRSVGSPVFLAPSSTPLRASSQSATYVVAECERTSSRSRRSQFSSDSDDKCERHPLWTSLPGRRVTEGRSSSRPCALFLTNPSRPGTNPNHPPGRSREGG